LQTKAASAFSASFPLASLDSDQPPAAAHADGRLGRMSRGPSTDRLKALSIVQQDDWVKGVTFADWCDLVQRSFERYFWIPEHKDEDCGYDIGSCTPWQRGMYKDCLACHDEWCMFQLRPNQAIAMAVAPFLFDSTHARVRPILLRCRPASLQRQSHAVALRSHLKLAGRGCFRRWACGCVPCMG
jgi:hypothetical protein